MKAWCWPFVLLLSFPSFSQTINLGSIEYLPYYGPQLENNGVVSELIQASFEQQNIKSNIEFFPWVRLLKMTREAKVDAMFTVWCTSERARDFLYSQSLFPNEVVFFKRKSLPITFHSMKDLRSYRIGYVFGYAYADSFYQEPGLKLIKGYSDQENVIKLLEGKVDLVVLDKYQGRYLIKKLAPNGAHLYDNLPKPLSVDQQYLMVSKKHEEAEKIIDMFNQGLIEIKRNGEFAALLKKHQINLNEKYWKKGEECNPN
ncbi:transporter substrate-binding domain-containing protein [Vibrio sp. S4M6]|uniref:substrate-binding periplasmic protein n=1 Tax=Vibrio sinus TaxID=2946865 RepID=UPI00202A01FE|nr:transporter substrate-binding domain-containing protein [Vibrio sinus]MCL9782253.1 transporter substrate-binding domain-containing protein [Vibrio sinus]